jgi:putative phosphoesterase
MRIALLSDIHGNSIALDAVLADIQAQGGADAYWALGDLIAVGFDPVGVVRRLTELPNARFVRGNQEWYLIQGLHAAPSLEMVKADPNLLDAFAEVRASFFWTLGAITAAGWLEWLVTLPREQRMSLPDGTRLLGIHVAPGVADGRGVRPEMSDEQVQALLAGCEADLVCVGHTHWATDRTVNNVRVVNLGSVGLPPPIDLRASYSILNADESGYQLERHRVEYDREAVIAELKRLRHPAWEYIANSLHGQYSIT